MLRPIIFYNTFPNYAAVIDLPILLSICIISAQTNFLENNWFPLKSFAEHE